MTDKPSSPPTEAIETEIPESLAPEPATFPPYPPYALEPEPASVADTIFAGKEIRVQHKSGLRPPVRPAPRPARPRGPKATDVKMTRKQMRAHARCLRRHGAVLTDRLERMSKPQRRNIIYLWREHQDMLPADTINRLRQMLDADEPFKPDQAYEYFINLKKTKRMKAQLRVNQIKKEAQTIALYTDKRFNWARNATVAFARGIQQRLSRPGRYALADGMLRLSNIILDDICGYMRLKTPSRACHHPKAKFMMEMADKVAVWIDEILSESDDKMLMMDFDEDEDLFGSPEGGDDGFADDFLNMMGGGGLLRGPPPAYMKFTGEMLEAFNILTESMQKKGDQNLINYGKFSQTYGEGADELKRATDFTASEYNTGLAAQLNRDLAETARPDTPRNIAPFMKEMVDICSGYLAQNAEYGKDKGPAFKLLVKQMKSKGSAPLYRKDKATRSFAAAATELEKAKGLDSDHDDPNLSQQIHSLLSKTVENVTPDELKSEMKDTVSKCSKYLSQAAVDENDKGPAFDLLIKELEKYGGDDFAPEHPSIGNKNAAAYVLKSAPGLSSVKVDPATVPKFTKLLHQSVGGATPRNLAGEMHEVVKKCAGYLSAFVRDRDKAMNILLTTMKSKPTTEFAKRSNYALNYGTGAMEVETAPAIVPLLPIKDIADEGKQKLSAEVEKVTPADLRTAMKSAVQDVSKYLSQPVALRSGVAGERYPLNFLTAAMKSLGKRPLYKVKSYGQTYADGAEVLKYAGPLEQDPRAEALQNEIATEITYGGMPLRLAPTITKTLEGTITQASRHIAKVGNEKAAALEHLVTKMKEKGDAPLGQIQGYTQSYADAAKRIENASSLTNDKVDKGVYEVVRGKLTQLMTEQPPPPDQAKTMPGVVDETSKFLAAPMPETTEDKRQLLSDLMAREGDKILGQDGLYKITYKEGGDEVKAAPVGVTKARNDMKKKDIGDKMTDVIPNKKLQELLKDPVNEASAHISDAISGRGEAMKVIHDNLQKEKDKEFLNVGNFKKTNNDVAGMLEQAPHFGGQQPSPVLQDAVHRRIDALNKDGASDVAKKHMQETVGITSNYVAGVATKECGLDAKALAALAASGGLGGPSARRPGETDEEYRRRLAAEAAGKGGARADGRRPGETEEEYRKRMAAEEAARRAGAGADGRRPGETEEEYRKRMAAEAARRAGAAADGRRPGETDEEYRKRLAEEENRNRLAEEEHRKRMAAEEAARKRSAGADGRRPGETDEEYRKRLAEEEAARRAGAGADGHRPGETEEEYRKRMADEAARRSGVSGRLPGESDEEYRRRMAAEEAARKDRRPGETEEEYRKRLAAEEAARRSGAGGAGAGADGRLPGETEEEYRRRMAAGAGGRLPGETDEEYRRRMAAAAGGGHLPGETEEEYRRRMAAEEAARKAGAGRRAGETEEEYRRRVDLEAEGALTILHTQLRAKGNEIFYKQPHTELTHTQASTWISMKPPMKVDKTVKESGDTARLSKKFERKLGGLVCKVTPPDLHDVMQDVIIESARILSEYFVSSNYKALARDGLVSEMQNRGNELLVELDGGAETAFFAAQRLKKANSLDAKEPCDQISYYLTKKLEEIVRCKAMPRKVTPTMKEHIKDAANYLSEHVTKPDEQIEAYVAMLEEMDANGNSLLIEGNIKKSYKDAAAYLRQLTSFEDQIRRPNSNLQSSTESKLKNIMANVPPRGYTKSILDGVIKNSASLLVSYIMLQGEKTEAIKCLIEKMDQAGENVLLRHGNIRKNYVDGADVLRGKNAAQLSVESADPVVSRKIQIKLDNLMSGCTPDKFQSVMDDVIEETTMYLAVHLLEARVIRVCKCMKNVFVQCELWCDEILRRVARPSCTCSRHTSSSGTHSGMSTPGTSRALLEMRACPKLGPSGGACPAQRPTFGCDQSSTYFTYPTMIGWGSPPRRESPSRGESPSRRHSPASTGRKSSSNARRVASASPHRQNTSPKRKPSPSRRPDEMESFHTPDSPNDSIGKTSTQKSPFFQTPTTMFATMHTARDRTTRRSSLPSSRVSTRSKSGFSSTRTPIISTDQMCDWHAMMISLMWNVQAWRDWIQENIDRALAYQQDADTNETDENWIGFQRRVTTESLQWRQYNIFSRQLTLRLSLRYRDTLIVSPTRATNRTQTYMECQKEMLEIIDMFNRWTQWLTAVVKETHSLQPNSKCSLPLHEVRWLHFKKKVKEYSGDWNKYNNHLKICWEQKYRSLISEWLPGYKQPGPVWVVSACGAVPSGAVAAGLHDTELIWVARTTHRCNVLPAALHPSKHCCIVYADGAVHQYTKYQVMCNAEASWVAWRAGSVGARAVRVARGVYIGRVHYRSGHLIGAVHAPNYRCHVIIFGRPFAFNCYELLVLEGDEA